MYTNAFPVAVLVRNAALCLALLLSGGALQAAGVYKWTDADGNLHFGDKPPANVEADAVTVRTGQDEHTAGRLNQMTDQAAANADKRSEARAEAAEKAKEAEEIARHCAESRETLRKLQTSTRQQYINDQGERAFIDEAKRQEWMATARSEIDKHCK